MDRLRSGVQDQAGQHGETPSLLKVQKLAGHDGTCLYSQLLGRLRQENLVNPGGGGGSFSEPREHPSSLGNKTETVSKKKKVRDQPGQHGETPSLPKIQN